MALNGHDFEWIHLYRDANFRFSFGDIPFKYFKFLFEFPHLPPSTPIHPTISAMSDHHDHHIPNPNHPEEVGDDEDDMSEEFDEEIEISPTTNLSSLFQFALLTAAHSSNISGNPLFHSLQSSPSSAGGSNSPSRLTDFQTLDRSRVLYSNLVKQ